MITLTYDDRLARLDTLWREGRILRERWTDTDDEGRELACLLAALSPEAGEAQVPSACPAEVLPPWLAHLTPSIACHTSDEGWPGILARYVALAHRWRVLTAWDWERADYAARAATVREARQHTTDPAALAAIDGVLALLHRAAQGEPVSDEEWRAARDAARDATESANWSSVARDATESANWSSAAWYAASSATRSAAVCSADVVKAAAWSAAWDRITDAVLSDLERRCDAREAQTEDV